MSMVPSLPKNRGHSSLIALKRKIRSKKPRFKWTDEYCKKFDDAVKKLGIQGTLTSFLFSFNFNYSYYIKILYQKCTAFRCLYLIVFCNSFYQMQSQKKFFKSWTTYLLWPEIMFLVTCKLVPLIIIIICFICLHLLN